MAKAGVVFKASFPSRLIQLSSALYTLEQLFLHFFY